MAETKLIPISDIRANTGQIPGVKRNPREIRDLKFEKLKKSLQDNPEMLELRELLVYEHEGRFICIGGNMRYRAAKELGYKEMPCKIIPPTATPDQLNAYIIKDNAAFGEWEWDMLANEWDTDLLDDWGVDFVDDRDMPLQEEEDAKEDDFDEDKEQIESRCKKGDIWQCGEHRLMCGDSTDAASVSLLMNGERADITFTSPPYNINTSKVGYVESKVHGKKTSYTNKQTYNEHSDDLSDKDYAKLLCGCLERCLSVSDEVLFNLGIVAGAKIGIAEMLYKFRNKFAELLYWEKTNTIPMGLPTQIHVVNHNVEPIFCFNQDGSRAFSHSSWKQGEGKNIIKTENAQSNEYAKIHHATFPVSFASEAVKLFSEKSVYDPFGGSGTTMIACEQLGRKCFMMELDPHYCDVILARWEKLTGKDAIKLS